MLIDVHKKCWWHNFDVFHSEISPKSPNTGWHGERLYYIKTLGTPPSALSSRHATECHQHRDHVSTNRKTFSESRVFGCYFTRVRCSEPSKKFNSSFDKNEWERSTVCSSTKKFAWFLLVESKSKRGTGSRNRSRGHRVTQFDLLGSIGVTTFSKITFL